MSEPNDGLRPLEAPRELLPHERAVIDELLSAPFPGRDQLRVQLESAQVVAEDQGDTHTLLFEVPKDLPATDSALRIPVEGETVDVDGTPISVLLHVLDGRATELEVYRVDGAPLRGTATADHLTVVVNEPSPGA